MATTTISTGQTLSGQRLTDGTSLLVAYGGTSTSNFVANGGVETVSGFSFGDTVSGAQSGPEPQLRVAAGAIVTGPQILGGATIVVSSGATVYGAVFSGSAQHAIAGTLNAASVGSGAVVGTEGQVVGGLVTAGGDLRLEAYAPYGYQASGVTVGAGGTLDIGFSEAVGTVVSGGSATVTGQRGSWSSYGESGQALGTQVLAGGVLTISNEGFDSGTVIGPGGTEHLKPDAASVGVVISGGTLELDQDYVDSMYVVSKSNTQVGGTITFAGNGGILRDDGLLAPTSVISGFNATDHIVLAGVTRDPNATLQVSGDSVVVSAGGQSYVLDIVGASALPLTFGQGGDAASINIACYCTGTAILTAEGEVAVEAIAPGDLVITADGRAEPVVWVGHRSYAGRFLQRQPHLLPIRIRAGALGRRLPRRDLLVSPNHAMLLDGALVPAGLLVNGGTVVQERAVARVDYHHIELRRHAVIVAEGAASESYLDDDNRALFANAAEHAGPGATGGYCAPRVVDGYRLEAIRSGLPHLAWPEPAAA